jgi:dipeptidyl aminopeptidase/acylaminoacyl peptidase
MQRPASSHPWSRAAVRGRRGAARRLTQILALACALPLSGAAALLVPSDALAQQVAGRRITIQESLRMPSWGSYQLSPDGRQIAFTKAVRDTSEWTTKTHIHVYDIASGATRQITNSTRGESNPRWLPDGRILFTSNRDGSNRLWAISPTGGEAARFIEDNDAPNGTFSPDYSRIAFTRETDREDKKEWEERVKRRDDGYYAEHKLTYNQVWVYDVASKTRRQVTSGNYDHGGIAWSPDGRWLAVVSNRTGTQMGDPNRSDNSDIFIVPADSGAMRQLTTHPGPDSSPVWSPDGQLIAYVSGIRENDSAPHTQIKVIASAGGQPRVLTTTLDYSATGPAWSPDSRTIYFDAAEGLTSRVYRVAENGSAAPASVLPHDAYVYNLQSTTPDNRTWLITGSSLSSTGDVFISETDGRRMRRLFSSTDGMRDYAVARAEPITWKGADGWDIEGILTYPLEYQPGQRYPLILQVHGGPHGRYSQTFGTGAQMWAARGYAVLQGNPRGSSGRTHEFSNANLMDWGGKDYIDIMNGVDHVIALGVADPDRMAIMGGSYGGFMTFWAVTQTNRFKAAIGHAGISDWYSFYGQTDIPHLLDFGFGGRPWATRDVYERWSPVRFAENVTTPLLITHGENDLRVPIAQAEQYFRTLKQLGRTTEFLRYPRAGHGITEPLHRIHLDGEQETWFRRFVLEGERPRPVMDENGGR